MFASHYIIVDNFYSNPYAVRDMALAMPLDSSGGNYAGSMTSDPFWTQDHRDILRRITGDELEAGANLCGRFRFTQANDVSRQHIHFDPGAAQIWAGVVYLTLPEHYEHLQTVTHNLGTSFWRHRRTGLDAIPVQQQVLDQYGWYGVDELREFLETEGMDQSLWLETLAVPMKFNRLVLFRPWLFHSPGHWFGNNRQDCRLIQTLFLRQSGSVA